MSLHGGHAARVVRVRDGDLLVFIAEVFDGRLRYDVEGATKKDVVRMIVNDVYL